MTAAAMLAKLSRCGIPVRRARNVALLALAAEVPAAALSPLLGIGLETAVRWTRRANRDWHAYVQARATSTEEPASPDPTRPTPSTTPKRSWRLSTG